MSLAGWNWPNVPKKQWGPRGWRWAHITAINYPPNPTPADAKIAFRRIWDFVANLPCVECRNHAMHYVTKNPPALGNSGTFQEWVWRFHNATNARLGKSLLSFENYRRIYAGELCWANWHEGCSIHGGHPN